MHSLLGYEDLNDHERLRTDLLLQTAVEQDRVLASASTLCRFENRASREAAWRLHAVMVDQFIASFKRAPKKLILDFDATDDAVHGKQEGRFFHGYYDHYCFLPLYVFWAESTAGQLSAPEQDRWCQARLGNPRTFGQAPSKDLAGGAHHLSRRFGLLSPPYARLV